jgi:hypothetical protein
MPGFIASAEDTVSISLDESLDSGPIPKDMSFSQKDQDRNPSVGDYSSAEESSY